MLTWLKRLSPLIFALATLAFPKGILLWVLAPLSLAHGVQGFLGRHESSRTGGKSAVARTVLALAVLALWAFLTSGDPLSFVSGVALVFAWHAYWDEYEVRGVRPRLDLFLDALPFFVLFALTSWRFSFEAFPWFFGASGLFLAWRSLRGFYRPEKRDRTFILFQILSWTLFGMAVLGLAGPSVFVVRILLGMHPITWYHWGAEKAKREGNLRKFAVRSFSLLAFFYAALLIYQFLGVQWFQYFFESPYFFYFLGFHVFFSFRLEDLKDCWRRGNS